MRDKELNLLTITFDISIFADEQIFINSLTSFKTKFAIKLVFLYSVCPILIYDVISGLILGLRPANGTRRYFVTTSLIG